MDTTGDAMRGIRAWLLCWLQIHDKHAICRINFRSHMCARRIDHRGKCWCECGERSTADDRMWE